MSGAIFATCALAGGGAIPAGAATPVLPSLPAPTQDMGAGCPTPASSQSQPWLNPAYTPECRAYFVVEALPSTAQKVTALTDGNATFKNLGLTIPGYQDGPAGDVSGNGVPQGPAPIGVGATWNTTMAAAYGNVIGESVRARNKGLLAAPVLDLMRTWHQARQAESFGEDPLLTGTLGSAEVPSIQQNHVEALLKHVGAYTQEEGRAGDAPTASGPNAPASFPNDEIVSLKALNELYLLPFGMAAQAGASGMMCAFPEVDGVHDCDDSYIMNLMRDEYGFQGEIDPDSPNAQHDLAGSINAGCDVCNLNYGGTTLAAQVSAGAVPVSTLNRMIYDQTVASIKVGLTDNPPSGAPSNTANVITPAENATDETIAEDGAVLLKNAHRILPLDAGATSSIAVIGPSASAAPIYAESGSPFVPPAAGADIAPLQGVRSAAPGTLTVNYAQGAAPVGEQPSAAQLPGQPPVNPFPVLSTTVEPTLTTKANGGSPGLTATYYGTPDWTGPAVYTDVENGVNLDGGIPNPAVAPGASNQNGGTIDIDMWSVTYRGVFTAPTAGTYVFGLDDGGAAKLRINGVLVDTNLDGQFGYGSQVAEHFSAGQQVKIDIHYTPRQASTGIIGPFQGALEVAPTITIGPYVSLGMVGPGTATSGTTAAPDTLISAAVAAAKASTVAVVFVGQASGEGADRSTLELPGAQDQLISAVAAANPNTVVVLNTGGPVLMPWLHQVKGVLQMWYPGDQFGNAAADLLFGNATPNGRLPQTWPAAENQGPGQAPSQYPGVYAPNRTTPTSLNETFDEGVDIGYRYYQADNETPLFPFGFGLSYTHFSFRPLTLTRTADGTTTANTTITDTGGEGGAEVAQLYLHFPATAGEAPWSLKAFGKVYLKPGQSQTVSFPITDQMLQNYNENQQQWVVTPGTYWLAVGGSSADFRGGASFHIGGRSSYVTPDSRRRPNVTKVARLSVRALRLR